MQKFLVKLFGYKLTYKTVLAKEIIVRAEDYPKELRNACITFEK